MNKSFSYNVFRCPNTSPDAPETIEVAAALTNGPLTHHSTMNSIFNVNSRLFIPAAPSLLGSGDVASNFRDKHDQTKNNNCCQNWINLFKNYSQISKHPVYVTAVGRTERRYTINMLEDGNITVIDNQSSNRDDEFTSYFQDFLRSFNISNEQMKVIRVSSSGAKYQTYFADLIGFMNMINQDNHPELFNEIWLKPTIIKSDAVNDSGEKLLQPVTSQSGRTWVPIENHDYLYFEQPEGKHPQSIRFNILKDGSMDTVYTQIKQLLSLEENSIKKMVRDFFLNQAIYIRWSDFWVNDIDDTLAILAIINSFKHTKLTKDETKIMVLFEEITKPWFDQLHI